MEANDPSNESSLRRRLLGFVMLPLAIFPFLALATYDWRDISDLCIPVADPPANLIGHAGAWFAYCGYQVMGLTIWVVPVACVLSGLHLIFSRSFQWGHRLLGSLLFLFAVTCLLQLAGNHPVLAQILHQINAAPNAGGAIGYLVMTRGLARILSPFGAGMLMCGVLLFSLLFMIGFKRLLRGIAHLTSWAADREESKEPEAFDASSTEVPDAVASQIRDAVATAQAQRLAEKQRLLEEKAARRAAKEEKRLRAREELQRARAELERSRTPTPPVATVPLPEQPVASNIRGESEQAQPYELPPLSLLNPLPLPTESDENPTLTAQRLIDTLRVFEVNAKLAYYVAGPVVTQYALTLDLGTRVEKIVSLARNIQMNLQATSLRIEAPIPGKNAVGIEVPNASPASICFRALVEGDLWREKSAKAFQVPLLLGQDAAGNDLVADLAKLPHLLVAGATGQGKSVCLNSIINGLLMCRTPEQLKFILVDPKRVEFTSYAKLPHLLVPIINDTKKVVFALRAAVVEMENRLKMFSKAGVKNIADFNARPVVTQRDLFSEEVTVLGVDAELPRAIPYIVIIVDEVADIMATAQKDVEPVIARLAALARATGIHLILATQRPDTKVITGTIKSNIPGRIAFKTASAIDSRTILDAQGSEQLIGKGDMLFKMADGRLLRAQGAFISDHEITSIVHFIGEQASVQFDEKLTKRLEKIKEDDPADALEEDTGASSSGDPSPDAEPLAAPLANGMPAPAGMTQSKEDQMYRKALEVLRDTKRASISHFQRRMGIGYNHAARIIDLLEERGVISTTRGAGPREIVQDPEAVLAQLDQSASPAPPPMSEQAPLDDPFAFPPDDSTPPSERNDES